MWRFFVSLFILLLCIAVCYEGIHYAIYVSKCDADAGRGGAIADALALGLIFLSRAYAATLFGYKIRFGSKKAPPETPVDEAEARRIAQEEIEKFLKLQKHDAAIQFWQNIFISMATVVGTLTWGFGDMIAQHYLGHRCP